MPTPPLLLPLWPRPGVVETLEWLTDIMIPDDGVDENRYEMRDAPRQSLQMSFFVPPARQARINNILYGGRTLQWCVPMWPQAQHIGAVAAAAASLACETRYSEFIDGGRVLLWQFPDTYQLLTMDSVTSDTEIALTDPAEEFTDAWLIPVRVGYLTGSPQRRLDGSWSALDATFMVEDNVALTVAAPEQYLGADIYFDEGLLDGGSTPETINAKFQLFDEDIGPVSYFDPWVNHRPTRVHKMIGEGAAESWAIRQFLHRRAGRSVEFWQPTFENDFRLNQTGAVAGTLTVRPDAYLTNAEARTHIAIETEGGWLARAITAAAVDADHMNLTLSASLGGIDASTILRVSYLALRRLDTDRAEIQWRGGKSMNSDLPDGPVCSVAVNTVEIQP